jgi:hypothetical protein
VLTSGRIVERYRVEELLGEGGTAMVYRVRHVHLGTDHALKVMTLIGAQAAPRLLLEGRVQAALRHPNIVAVTDVLEIDGSFGLLMEYVPPPSLSAWIARSPPSVETAEALFRGVVAGVRHAHAHGLVHRDLKPANVLLARGEGGVDLIPKVADFGLARLLDDEGHRHTRTGLAMGTPQYMAPEQFRDAKGVDRRADLFSLGCILHELLSGAPAFAWSDLIGVYGAITKGAWAPLPASVPERLRAAVVGCLEPEAARRIPDCDALLAVLDGRGRARGATLVPEAEGPPDAPTPPPAAAARPRLGRGPIGVGVAVVVVAGLAWAAWPASTVGDLAERQAEPVAPAAVPPDVVAVAAPVVEPAPVDAPVSAPVVSPPVSRPSARPVEIRPAAAPTPVPLPTLPAEIVPPPAEPPPAEARAAVRATGAKTAWLIGAGGPVPLPARVEPGRYQVWADFGAGGVSANEVTLAAGDDIELRCSEGFQSCPAHR